MQTPRYVSCIFIFSTIIAISAEAKVVTQKDQLMCHWGANTAATAQELKMSRSSLYVARQKIQATKFDKTWMRMMALNITEQTYDSSSQFTPEAVRRSFYNDCINIRHFANEPFPRIKKSEEYRIQCDFKHWLMASAPALLTSLFSFLLGFHSDTF